MQGRRLRYDYLLVAGPGRSGSTWLYRALGAHPQFASPGVKEAFLYRSPRRFERARRRAGGAVVVDAANRAWRDRRLGRLARLPARGHRVLAVVLLRRHRDRAVSSMAFRRSRVLPALWAGLAGGAGGLERAVLRDSLTPAALARLHGLGVDVVTVSFEALSQRPAAVLGVVAGLCGAAPFRGPPPAPANAAVRARRPALAAAGKLAAVVLRTLGAARLVQRLKDDPRVMAFFFCPAGPGSATANGIALGPGTRACLDRRYRACRAAAEASGEALAEGVWLRRAGRCPAHGRAGPR